MVSLGFENVAGESIERMAEGGALGAPGRKGLRVSQDRADEKTFLNAVGAPTVAFAVIEAKLESPHLDDIDRVVVAQGSGISPVIPFVVHGVVVAAEKQHHCGFAGLGVVDPG
mgnify:CR=1 FL=1